MPPVRHLARKAAFTLVEVLLTLVLVAALLLAMNQFTFTITEAWTRSQDRLVFNRHAQAVTDYVTALLGRAARQARASGTATNGLALAKMTLPQGAGTAVMLQFDLPAGDRHFTGPGATLPEMSCALGWSAEDGLALYWKSRLELEFATEEARRTGLSPFVKSVGFDYFESATGTWTEKTEPESDGNGAYLLPQRLRLLFVRGDQQIEQVVNLPPAAEEGVPLE
jgi:prepilin-type N-terminal cleavage/methylation domain-containing protein